MRSPSLLTIALAIFSFVLVSAPDATAQSVASPPPAACTGGRTASELTLWRCCWPGQVWNDDRARCSGPPLCPSGLQSQGDDCVATARDASTEMTSDDRIARAIEEDRRRAGVRDRIPYAGGPVPAGYRLVRGASSLFGPGVALMVIGYVPSLITGTIGVGTGGPGMPLAWSYVPIIGMPLAAGLCGSSLCNASPAGYIALLLGGSVASVLQLTGAILAIIGGNAPPPYLRRESTETARVRVAPWFGLDGGGLFLTVGTM